MLNKFLGYILFWKKSEPGANFNLRMMHGINRVSILMFIVALIVIITRLLKN
jgi:hypothetical protein